eukprot:7336617-Karenia_brevis.AAC.1
MTSIPPTLGPRPPGSPIIDGNQHGSGADRSGSLVLSPAGARGEVDLFGGADMQAAAAAAAVSASIAINDEDDDLAYGGKEGSSLSGEFDKKLIKKFIA